MNLVDMLFVVFLIVVVIFWIVCFTKEIRKYRRKVPDGKVFIKEFVEMVQDTQTAVLYLMLDKKIDYIDINIKEHNFKVSIKSEASYEGLTYSTIPMYMSCGIYIDDEIVCRLHIINDYLKKRNFIEFSSKRNIDEVLEILKGAHSIAKEHIRARFPDCRCDRKSFYGGDSK